MSKYTTEVRFICETAAGLTESSGYNSVNQTLDACWENVFNFDFPIFDSTYRGVLCKKILKHYYTREIAQETVGLWKMRMDTRLNEIMPYYNKLYESELLTFNPLYDVDVTTTHEKTGKSDSVFSGSYTDSKEGSFEEINTGKIIHAGTETTEGTNSKTNSDNRVTDTEESGSTTNGQTTTDTGSLTGKTNSKLTAIGSSDKTSKETTKYSDTPQGALTNVEDGTYLTNATIKDGTENNTTSDTQNGEVNNTQNSTNESVVEGAGSESKTGKVTDTLNGTESGSTTGSKEDSFTDDSTGSKSGSNNESGTRTSGENTTVNSTEDYVTKVMGKSNSTLSYAKMLMEFRDTFLNIDMMIISDLGDLFFGLW